MDSIKLDRARSIAWDYASRQSARSDCASLSAVSETCRWRISHPINDLAGREGLAENFWRPLERSFPDFERRNDIFMAGAFADKIWVASTGYIVGTFEKSWLGIPATSKPLFVRFGEILEMSDAKIVSGHMILDIVGAARQAGVDLVPQGLGAELLAPAPITQDGLRLQSSGETESQRSRALVEAMIAGLMEYDRKSIGSMHQQDFWDRNMLWYGPAGIGTAKGLSGFQKHHQIPFLNFVPDRIGGNHLARIADGNYIASGGWPSIRATTSGAPWISTALPANIPVTMRVMDFWRREGDLLKENWVFIDIPDVFRQCGIDVFDQLNDKTIA